MNSEKIESVKLAIELTLLPGVGNLTQKRVLERLPNIAALFALSLNELEAYDIPKEARLFIRSRAYRQAAEEIHAWAAREGVSLLMKGEPEYPGLLDEIYDPPLLLYARGNLEALQNPRVAIVGTRRPTVYGLQMAEGFGTDLGKQGLAVVSGLARGIDAAAHRGCVEKDGVTIAVLGSGIDVIYPSEHQRLADKIVRKGLLLSEFPPGTSPSPQNFPIRNRVISGMSLGVLVIEASEHSGSLITARLAMEQNRELFAIPGNITVPQSFGPNFLIKQGAKLAQVWRDIVEELPSEIRQNIFLKEGARSFDKSELSAVSEDAAKLLELLKEDEAVHFDRLLSRAGLPISRLSGLLLELELGGHARQLPGNLYVRLRESLKTPKSRRATETKAEFT